MTKMKTVIQVNQWIIKIITIFKNFSKKYSFSFYAKSLSYFKNGVSTGLLPDFKTLAIFSFDSNS